PPPPDAPSVSVYTGTSRPRPYHLKHPPPQSRALPRLKSPYPPIILFSLLGISLWALFITYVTNQEKMSSSVVKGIVKELRGDSGLSLRQSLGDAIRMQGEWWLNGDPWVRGNISTMQGNIDLSFRVRGTKGAGTVYFTSIRRDKGLPFEILRFKVISDDGKVI
ncbi:DUF1783-domain-containing protein, partial [Gymnopus androsaceus JB14]